MCAYIWHSIYDTHPAASESHRSGPKSQSHLSAPKCSNSVRAFRKIVEKACPMMTETVVNVQEAPNNNAAKTNASTTTESPLGWIKVNVDYFKTIPGLLKIAEFGIIELTMGDPLEHATGLEKRELLAKMGGNDNPFDQKVFKRGAGTRACPNEIPSAFDSRLVGCICDEEASSIMWMWLHKGEPRRCECGHWFSLVHKAPV
ncbi:hypothetical protein NQ317_002865 [Molorchus minor]|uniref:Cytochrome c oxidase subunit 5B, mitochondrial n=1 Tax=Molorchus minor TaxID=1323400 RepID=A0ABQ9JVQ4_9CUCU|nr:hypothetical protein NQ317_002865 [Molorchus minor]